LPPQLVRPVSSAAPAARFPPHITSWPQAFPRNFSAAPVDQLIPSFLPGAQLQNIFFFFLCVSNGSLYNFPLAFREKAQQKQHVLASLKFPTPFLAFCFLATVKILVYCASFWEFSTSPAFVIFLVSACPNSHPPWNRMFRSHQSNISNLLQETQLFESLEEGHLSGPGFSHLFNHR